MALEVDFDVGARLSAVRKMHHMSQRELAKRAGVTNGTISLIEQNRVSPSVSSLRKVLQGLPMSFSDFFSLEVAPRQDVFFAAGEFLRVLARAIEADLGVTQLDSVTGCDLGKGHLFPANSSTGCAAQVLDLILAILDVDTGMVTTYCGIIHNDVVVG